MKQNIGVSQDVVQKDGSDTPRFPRPDALQVLAYIYYLLPILRITRRRALSRWPLPWDHLLEEPAVPTVLSLPPWSKRASSESIFSQTRNPVSASKMSTCSP
jgi:hypothetical protein